MREFVLPEIHVTQLAPANSIMDDITLSKEIPAFAGREIKVDVTNDKDEAVW